MPRWMLSYEYPQEGGGGVLPYVLTDREKHIFEKCQKLNLLDSMKAFTFTQVENEEFAHE
jgi:hypothetical protein